MSQLPQGWDSIQLKDLLSFVLGGDWGKNPEYNDDDFETVFCIRGSEFKNWSKEKGASSVERKIKSSSVEKRALKSGDILIEISGGGPEQPVGRTVLIDDVALSHNPNYPKVCTNFIRLTRPKDSVDSRYLNYYLQSFYTSGEVVNYQGGSNNLRNLKFKEYETIQVPVAPFEEQKRIADKLDSVLAKVEAAQARLDKIPSMLKRFRQSVLAAATSGELTKDWREENGVESAANLLTQFSEERQKLLDAEVADGNKETKRLISKLKKHNPLLPDSGLPAGWVWTSFMSSMVKVVDCHNKTAPYIDVGIPLIRTPDIRNGVISLEGAKYISEETYDYWSRRCPPEPGDIIFTREAPMGEAGIVPEGVQLCMGQRMMLLRPDPRYVSPDYLVFNTLSLDFKERMNGQAIGTGVKHLRVADVEALTYPLPPYEEQLEVVERVTELFEHANTVEKQYKVAKARLDKLTQSILAKAFRGELM